MLECPYCKEHIHYIIMASRMMRGCVTGLCSKCGEPVVVRRVKTYWIIEKTI